MRKILMIAAEIPPCLSAGVQRTYHFAENLLVEGWQPIILSAHPRIYKNSDNNLKFSPEIERCIVRAPAADASVHFAINGKYFDFLEDPDKFSSWYYFGWRKGLSLIKQHDPDFIWSTFPVSTAHRIALKLKRESKKAWVADFRDPLHSHCDNNFKKISEKAKHIDQCTIKEADYLVFATKHMRDLYLQAFPDIDARKFFVIENGYDESIFSNLIRRKPDDSVFTLLYSGGLYTQGRDPTPLFAAISELLAEGKLNKNTFNLHFRGAGDGRTFHAQLKQQQLEDMVSFLPPVSFKDSVQEMKDADGLLVLQGKTFDNQIPGKVYEYIATQNPILALTGQVGATRKMLSEIPEAFCAEEDNILQIKNALLDLISAPKSQINDTKKYSRHSRSKLLLEILNNPTTDQPTISN